MILFSSSFSYDDTTMISLDFTTIITGHNIQPHPPLVVISYQIYVSLAAQLELSDLTDPAMFEMVVVALFQLHIYLLESAVLRIGGVVSSHVIFAAKQNSASTFSHKCVRTIKQSFPTIPVTLNL